MAKQYLDSCGQVYFQTPSNSWTTSSPTIRPSQRPRGLRHKPSSPARTLWSWVRIPLEAWISVCVYSVCVVLCVGSGLATGWSPVQGVLPLWIGLRNWKSGRGTKGCRATERDRPTIRCYMFSDKNSAIEYTASMLVTVNWLRTNLKSHVKATTMRTARWEGWNTNILKFTSCIPLYYLLLLATDGGHAVA
jgi:hypothetical protein